MEKVGSEKLNAEFRTQNSERRKGRERFLRSAFCVLHSAFAFLASLSCASASAPPPSNPATQQPSNPQAIELSTITIPIRSTLAPLLPQLESQVPKEMKKLDGYELDPSKQFGLKYRVTRDPIALNMLGTGLHATVTVRYQFEGCRQTKKPFSAETTMWPCISCGFGEPMREAYIAIDSHLEWDASWRLKSKTNARPVEFPNRCKVTFANVDISDWKIGPLVNEQLRDVAKTIDQQTPRLTNLRPNAAQIWTALQAPQEVAPKTWLVLEPVDLAVAPLTGSGLSVQSALALKARTRLVIGERPNITAAPLPPLRSEREAAGGIRVPFDVELPYSEAGRIITEQFARKYRLGNGELSLESLALSPGRDGRLTIAASIDYRGGGLKKYRGLVYLEGTPQFDATTKMVTIANVDYTLDPRRKNPFVRTANRLAHDSVRKAIAGAASWSIAPQLAGIRTEIAKAISRPLAKGITLRGTVDSIEPSAILLNSDRIVIRGVLVGGAEIEATTW
jgi:hypothetical protein